MPITHTTGATIITGDRLDDFALCAKRGAVGLEMKGIKMRRGPVLWKQYAKHYNIPASGKRKSPTIQEVYDWLTARVNELQEHIVKE